MTLIPLLRAEETVAVRQAVFLIVPRISLDRERLLEQAIGYDTPLATTPK